MKNKVLTNITKSLGNFIAQKTKDADNELFSEISEKVIKDFINEIKSDNPILANWVEDWMKNKTVFKPKSSTYGWCNDEYSYRGSCGSYKKTYSGGCGISSGGC